jgi:hypothetical protein
MIVSLGPHFFALSESGGIGAIVSVRAVGGSIWAKALLLMNKIKISLYKSFE